MSTSGTLLSGEAPAAGQTLNPPQALTVAIEAVRVRSPHSKLAVGDVTAVEVGRRRWDAHPGRPQRATVGACDVGAATVGVDATPAPLQPRGLVSQATPTMGWFSRSDPSEPRTARHRRRRCRHARSEPVARSRRRGVHADDWLVQPQRSGGAADAGITEGEDPPSAATNH